MVGSYKINHTPRLVANLSTFMSEAHEIVSMLVRYLSDLVTSLSCLLSTASCGVAVESYFLNPSNGPYL